MYILHPLFVGWVAIVVSCLLSVSCTGQVVPVDTTPLFQIVPATTSGIHFSNDVFETEQYNPMSFPYTYNGGGVATADLNSDGLPEIIFTSNQQGITLYRNRGNLSFEDVTRGSGLDSVGGWMTGITVADVNGDGRPDIYVCRSGFDSLQRNNLLFINLDNLKFREQAAAFGLHDPNPSTHAAFFDYDKDGDLDALIINHHNDYSQTNNFHAYGNQLQKDEKSLYRCSVLLENDRGTFRDVSELAGVATYQSYSLSVCIADVNGDGWEDVFIANDFFSPDKLFINNGNKTFSDQTTTYFTGVSLSSMGAAFGDLNNDGHPDLMELEMMPNSHSRMKKSFLNMPLNGYYTMHEHFKPRQYIRNSLFVSNRGKSFIEISEFSGVARTDWSWSVLIEDFDNDSRQDIFVSNGLKYEYYDLDYTTLQDDLKKRMQYQHSPDSFYRKLGQLRLTNYLYQNRGRLKFENTAIGNGLEQAVVSNGAIAADLDRDGDLDLVLNNTDTTAFVYRNLSREQGRGNYIQFSLSMKEGNTQGIGTKVYVYTAEGMQYKQLSTTQGFQSSPEAVLHFGLGKADRIDSVRVIWPNGNEQLLAHVGLNQLYFLAAEHAAPKNTADTHPASAWQSLQPQGAAHRHREAYYQDMRKDRLFLHEFSKEGPGAAAADINRDGLDDIFIGGAYKGSPCVMLVQQPDGRFEEMKNQPWHVLNIENREALFADFNGDGYPDLYLANGTNEMGAYDTLQHDRLFYNRKGARFEDVSHLLPPMPGIKSSPLAFDFNGDGQLDIFIATRMFPGSYPDSGRCYLLENRGNEFADVTPVLQRDLQSLGNVTAACIADLNNDGVPELVIAPEWNTLKFYTIRKDRLEPFMPIHPADTIRGFWKCVVPVDADGDGDMDLWVGNQGSNSYPQASLQEPITLYYGDFDGNGVKEPLIFHYLNGEKGILYDRNTYCEQMPKFRNKFLTYESFATASFTDLVTDPAAKVYSVNYTQSGWLENNGKGQFTRHEAGYPLQWSPVNTFYADDVNGDGLPEIIAGMNCNNSLYWTGDADGVPAPVLVRDTTQEGQFSAQPEWGLDNRYVCKKILKIMIGGRPVWVFVNNNAPVLFYSASDK